MNMNNKRLVMFVGIIILSLALAGMTLAADISTQGQPPTDTESDSYLIEVIVDSTQSDMAVPFEGVITPAGPGLEGSAGTSGFGDPEAVLWDNGPLVTHPADCAGMDASRLQTDLGMLTLGFGHQYTLGYHIADDFTIPAAEGWQIDQLTFFAYQTSAPISPSPITGIYYQIWDGPPDNPASSIIYGDLVTNRLLSSVSPNLQRDSGTNLCTNNRYIFADVAGADVILTPGTYWIDWTTDGSLASGPWAPPVTILGQTTTGNALQYTTAWEPALDSGVATQQGMPFIIEGSINLSGLELTPETASQKDCEKSDVTYSLNLANSTGANATFLLTYASSWPVSGPGQLYVPDGSSANFDVMVHIPCGGVSDVTTVTATGNGFTDSSALTTYPQYIGFTDWEDLAPINGFGRSRPAGAAVNGKIYVIGGEIPGGGRADTVEEFNPSTGIWTTQAGLMPTPASNICAAAIGTDIYVPGGYDEGGAYLATLQVYHVASDSWEVVVTDPLPAPRFGLACAALNGKLYAFGGIDGTYQNTAYVYDPAAAAGSRWTTLPNMAYARAYLAGTAVNGKIYALGGGDSGLIDLPYVEAFDPADGAWHTVTGMNTARSGLGAYFINDWIIVCGGGWSAFYNTCEAYNTAYGYSGSWVYLDQTMIAGRRTFAYVSLPNALYAVAGFDGDFMTSAERLPYVACEGCQPNDVNIRPYSLNAAQPTDTMTTQQLRICNEGESLLNWALAEVPATKEAEISIPANNGNFPRGDHPDSIGPAPYVNPGDSAPQHNLTLAGEPAFGLEYFPAVNLVQFPNTSSPNIWNVIAPESGSSQYFAGDFINGNFARLYVLDMVLDSLHVINTTTGADTLIGPSIPISDEGWTGMTGAVDGIMYASSTNLTRSTLYTINLATGTASLIGEITNAPGIIDIAIAPNGQMYGVDIVTDMLISINRVTGAGTVIGSLGFDANYAQGMDFEENTGSLYLAAFNNSAFRGELRIADTSTGNTTLVGAFPAGAEVTSLGFNTGPGLLIPWLSENPTAGVTHGNSCRVVDVTFDSTGLPNSTYIGELRVVSNDPDEPALMVPITLEVGAYRHYLPVTQKH
jgi:hypothetical protein